MYAIAVLVACFAVAYGQLLYRDDSQRFDYNSVSGYEEDTTLNKMQDILKEAGTLRVSVEKYVIQPDEALARYAKKLIMEGDSLALTGISVSDVDEVLSGSRNSLSPITIFNIGSELSGDDLFKRSEWRLEPSQKSEALFGENYGDFYVEEYKPLLVSKTDDFVCELIIGPSISTIDEVNLPYFNGLNHQQNAHFILSSPFLNFDSANPQSIRYGLFMHDTEINGHSVSPGDIYKKGKFEKVIQLIRGITEKLEEDIRNMEPEHHLEVDYTYSAKAEMISLSDDKAMDYVRDWVEIVNKRRIRINLYGMIRKYIRDPLSLRIYSNPADIPHDHHEFEGEFDNAVLFMDRDPEDEGIFYRSKNLNRPKRRMNNFLDNTLSQILNRVQSEGLPERNMNQWQNWIMSLIKRDFQNFRNQNGVKSKFSPTDKHFSGSSKTLYRPSSVPAPIYGLERKIFCQQPRGSSLGRPICSY